VQQRYDIAAYIQTGPTANSEQRRGQRKITMCKAQRVFSCRKLRYFELTDDACFFQDLNFLFILPRFLTLLTFFNFFLRRFYVYVIACFFYVTAVVGEQRFIITRATLC